MENIFIGLKLTNKQPFYAKAAEWCNENNAFIESIGENLYEVKATPAPTFDEFKKQKLEENVQKRDARLRAGVLFKDVMFDSDTDSKINIMGAVSTLPDDAVVGWNSMDNETVTLTKPELAELGGLLVALTSAIWGENGLNMQFIQAINSAQTVEELDSIEITYPMNLEKEENNG